MARVRTLADTLREDSKHVGKIKKGRAPKLQIGGESRYGRFYRHNPSPNHYKRTHPWRKVGAVVVLVAGGAAGALKFGVIEPSASSEADICSGESLLPSKGLPDKACFVPAVSGYPLKAYDGSTVHGVIDYSISKNPRYDQDISGNKVMAFDISGTATGIYKSSTLSTKISSDQINPAVFFSTMRDVIIDPKVDMETRDKTYNGCINEIDLFLGKIRKEPGPGEFIGNHVFSVGDIFNSVHEVELAPFTSKPEPTDPKPYRVVFESKYKGDNYILSCPPDPSPGG